jgi:putative sterol carrier protein
MKEPEIEVIEGESDVQPDVKMAMSADTADKYWRGEYNVAVGLAKGEVKAKGSITTILKLIPATKPLYPMYKGLVAEKDSAAVGS